MSVRWTYLASSIGHKNLNFTFWITNDLFRIINGRSGIPFPRYKSLITLFIEFDLRLDQYRSILVAKIVNDEHRPVGRSRVLPNFQ